MRREINFNDYDSDIKGLAEGQQIHVNHINCPAGSDTKKRLYLKRAKDGAVVLGYCHHCSTKGVLRLKSNRPIKSLSILRKEIAHEVEQDKTWIPPLTRLNRLTYDDNENYTHLKGWLTQFGFAGSTGYKLAPATHWLQYQLESGRIFLPYYKQLIVGTVQSSLCNTPHKKLVKGVPNRVFHAIDCMGQELWCSSGTDTVAGYQSRYVPNRKAENPPEKMSKYLTHRIDKEVTDSLITVVDGEPGDEGQIVLNWVVEDLMSQIVLASHCIGNLHWRMPKGSSPQGLAKKDFFAKVNIWSMMGSEPSTRMINAINASINDHGNMAAPLIMTDQDPAGEKARQDIMKATTLFVPEPRIEFKKNEPKHASHDDHFKLTYHQIGDALDEYHLNQVAPQL